MKDLVFEYPKDFNRVETVEGRVVRKLSICPWPFRNTRIIINEQNIGEDTKVEVIYKPRYLKGQSNE
ncbi:hypothetical protein LCGC14_2809820 [marine sediment metagenome]|uniref:Uncharacterized protein n=1 Tax=marine sediment metagenome TaxID=412755 RepID=A0A0F9BBH5_9ZZZZ